MGYFFGIMSPGMPKKVASPVVKKLPRRADDYHPYHPRGEVVFLLTMALLAIGFLMVPMNFWLKLAGAFILLVLLPVNVLREYWPKVPLHDLGWRSPAHPLTPWPYSTVVTVLAFLPLVLFFTVPDPGALVAVAPRGPWLDWLVAEALVSGLWLVQGAFFNGLLLFRLTHLMRPWVAILVVGLITGIAQLFGPGSLQLLLVPVAVALSWMAWQTKSFVPATVATIAISFIFDFFVRLTA